MEWANGDGLALVGSSGNLSGSPNSYTIAEMPRSILDGVDYWYDDGPAEHRSDEGLATTMVNLQEHTVERVGVLHDFIVESYRRFARQRPVLPAELGEWRGS